MKKTINILICILFFSTFCFSQKKEEKQVRKAFEKYKTAILSDKGKEAVNSVDTRTINYYNKIINETIALDSIGLDSLGTIDKLTVLTLKHKASKKELLKFDGKGVLEYAIKNGMVGKSSVVGTTIGEVIIEDNFAKGQLVKNGQEAPFYFHFYKEDEVWKIDITSLFSIGTIAIQKMIKDSGTDENVFFVNLLELITNKKPGTELWQPIK